MQNSYNNLFCKFDYRTSSVPLLLSPSTIEQASTKATHVLNTVQRFFSFHLIQTHSCEYTSQGMSLESLKRNLKTFFDSRTNDGQRMDTYFIYYYGPMTENGCWALGGQYYL